MRCYTLSGVCNHLGMSWEPTQEMLNAVKKKKLVKEHFWKIPKDKQTEHWRKIIDPRENYFLTK